MAEDYYATLGISSSATPEDIQKAYRQLARKHHPDLNPDDASSKAKFQAVQTAFDVLNDPKKRELYDRYGSAYESYSQGAYGPGNAGPQSWPPDSSGGPNVDINLEDLFGGSGLGGGGFADIFKNFSQRGKRSPRRQAPTRGANIEQELTVPFTSAILGGEAQIAVQRENGKIETIQVKIPAGIESGKKIRLRNQGNPSNDGGSHGDLLIKVQVAPHPFFRRQGKRLDLRVPITLDEAIRGAKIDVPTPHGTITLTVPPNASSGRKLRVKGHGVKSQNGAAGDLFAELLVMLPDEFSSDDREQILLLSEKYQEDLRSELQW